MRNPDRETTFRFRQFAVENRRSAMKVGTDGVLLGAWALVPPGRVDAPRVLDAGAGTGLVSLMIAQRYPAAVVNAVELDEESAIECAGNFARSPWCERLAVTRGDFLGLAVAERYNLVVSNPPFFTTGERAPDQSRQLARHEDSLPLGCLVRQAVTLLEPGCGALALVLPADRLAEARYHASLAGLREWRCVELRTSSRKPPRRVLVEFLTPGTSLDSSTAGFSSEYLTEPDGARSAWHRELVRDFYIR